MCGIFGCILTEGNAAPIIHAALKRLEYRGYDSVGEATIDNGKIYLKKDAGKIDEVHAIRNLDDLPGRIGIGHTRWATHGAPSQVNAHPHFGCSEPPQIAVVHNGIIENYAELKRELEDLGHKFRSKTDTEVIAHLLEENLMRKPNEDPGSQTGAGSDFKNAVLSAVQRFHGSYAIAVVSAGNPNTLICARNESPLVLGIADGASYLASDVPAILPLTNEVVFLENGEFAVVTKDTLEVRKISSGVQVQYKPRVIDWSQRWRRSKDIPTSCSKRLMNSQLAFATHSGCRISIWNS